MSKEYRVTDKRLSIKLDDDVMDKLSNMLPWGTRNKIYEKITTQLIALIEKHGQIIIGMIYDGHVQLTGVAHGDDRKFEYFTKTVIQGGSVGENYSDQAVAKD